MTLNDLLTNDITHIILIKIFSMFLIVNIMYSNAAIFLQKIIRKSSIFV